VFTAILANVTLPALARVKGGVTEIGRHVAAALAALSAAAFPVSVLSAVLATPLVELVYGRRWLPAAPVLVVLAVFGSVRVIASLLSDVLTAAGQTRPLLHTQLIWFAALVPAMIIAVYLDGPRGAAFAHVGVVLLVVLPTYLVVLRRSVGLAPRLLASPPVYPLLAALAAGAAAALAALAVDAPWAKLVVGVTSFGVVYLALLARWLRRLFGELKSLYGHRPPAGDPVPDLVAAQKET
jgi:PST family polysaccharide transporter